MPSYRDASIIAKITPTDFDLWQDGELTDQEFLEKSAQALANLQDSLEPQLAVEKLLRGHISIVVERMGGKAAVPGFASFVITEASQTVSYDNKKLDRLVAELVSGGYDELARQITACRSTGSRSGSLRITRAKD
jgi:hypothetical protein